MTKILYGITKSNFGGAQRYVLELSETMKNQGFEVEVMSGGNGTLFSKLSELNIPTHQLDSIHRDISILAEYKSLFRLYKVIKKSKPDIIHLNSPKLGGLGSVVARLAGVKNIIYTNHGWPFKEHRPLWQTVLIKFFSWLTILFNHKIIVLSEKEKEMVKNWPLISKKKVFVVPIGIQAFVPEEKDSSLMSLLGEEESISLIKKDTRIIGTVGELTKNKGYIYTLEGIAKYKKTASDYNSHYIIIGDGEDKNDLIAYRDRLGLEKDVTFTGNIPDARNFIKSFDIFLLGSVKEGLPYVLLEAGYAGVPIASTNVGGIPELITNYETGFLIKPKSAEDIKEVFLYIDEYPGEARQYAESLRTKIHAIYSFENMVKNTLNIYNS